MLTSTDEAQYCVNSLRNRIPRNTSVLIGHYRLHDNYVTLVLKRQDTKGVNFAYRRKKREPVHDSGEQTFHIVSIEALYISRLKDLCAQEFVFWHACRSRNSRYKIITEE